MDYSLNQQGYVYIHDGCKLHFDKIEVKCGTKVSEFPVIGNHIDVAIEGAKPTMFILTGRFFISDFEYLSAYISNKVGYHMRSLSINGKNYYNMILLDAQISVDSSKLFGNMVFRIISS